MPDTLPGPFLDFIQAAHTGLPIPSGFTESGDCATFDQGITDPLDGIARGYITVDNVNQCSTATATSADLYFGEITNNGPEANVLWGDYFLVDPTGNFAQGDTLVHIEANGKTRDRYTFYGRYFDEQFTAGDSREALPTTWAYRYFEEDAGPFTEGTDVICWRDTGSNDVPYLTPPGKDEKNEGLCVGFGKLAQDQIVIFDEDEDAVTVTIPPDVFSPGAGRYHCPELGLPLGDTAGGRFDLRRYLPVWLDVPQPQ